LQSLYSCQRSNPSERARLKPDRFRCKPCHSKSAYVSCTCHPVLTNLEQDYQP
jgi:hypothetical protein